MHATKDIILSLKKYSRFVYDFLEKSFQFCWCVTTRILKNKNVYVCFRFTSIIISLERGQKQALTLYFIMLRMAKHTLKILRCKHRVASLKPAALFKKRLWHRYFHVNLAKFSITSNFIETSGDCF